MKAKFIQESLNLLKSKSTEEIPEEYQLFGEVFDYANSLDLGEVVYDVKRTGNNEPVFGYNINDYRFVIWQPNDENGLNYNVRKNIEGDLWASYGRIGTGKIHSVEDFQNLLDKYPPSYKSSNG